MTVQVYIGREDFLSGGLTIAIVDHHDGTQGPGRIYRPGAGGGSWEEFNPTDAFDPVAPSFTLPWDTGRALLDALANHYQGREDTRALRRDYDAERKRVDDQAKVLADVVKALAMKTSG